MTSGVYKITNLITNKNYIGVSIHIEQRWKEHQKGKGSKSLFQDFLEYGTRNFSFEIIEECGQELFNDREPYWIEYYNAYKEGYNENPGGLLGNLQAIEATQKEIFCYDLDGNFIAGYESISEAERQTGVANSNISKAARQVDRLIAGGYQWRYEKFDKIPPYKRTCRFKENPGQYAEKAVDQYDKQGNYITTYNSMTEAANKTGANDSCIGEICKTKGKGKRKTSGGYIWRYKGDTL